MIPCPSCSEPLQLYVPTFPHWAKDYRCVPCGIHFKEEGSALGGGGFGHYYWESSTAKHIDRWGATIEECVRKFKLQSFK